MISQFENRLYLQCTLDDLSSSRLSETYFHCHGCRRIAYWPLTDTGMLRHLLWIQHHWMRHLSQLPMMSTKLRQIFFSIGVRSVAFCFHRLVTMQNWNWNFRPRCHRLQDQSAHHNTCNWAHLLHPLPYQCHHVVHACIRCISTTSIDTILIIRCKGVRDLDVEVPHTNTIPLRVITQHNCTPDWKA